MSGPKIFTFEQGTPEWYAARLGIPTASEFDTVQAKGKGGGTSVTRTKYMLTLIGERETGKVVDSYSNLHMERGKIMEAEARAAYEFQTDNSTERVGFIRNGDAGASPDSLIGKNGLLEIKTKIPALHYAVRLADRLPPEHVAQVQGQLWIAEREWCDFVSYWPDTMPFVKRVFRDEAYIAALKIAVQDFNDELLSTMAKLGVTPRLQEAA